MAGDGAQGAQQGSPTDEVTSSGTGTNVQESGVDEPDVVKTNGSILVRMDGEELTTYDVTGATPVRLGSVDVPPTADAGYDGGASAPELLLVGDSAVVLAAAGSRTTARPPWSTGSTSPTRPGPPWSTPRRTTRTSSRRACTARRCAWC